MRVVAHLRSICIIIFSKSQYSKIGRTYLPSIDQLDKNLSVCEEFSIHRFSLNEKP